MAGSKKGSGYGGMARAKCPRCMWWFRKSARQIQTGRTECIDNVKCAERARRTPPQPR
jgi:hypothetical protein